MEISDKKIIVTGGAGFLGGHLVNLLKKEVNENNIFVPRSKDYDLRKVQDIEKMFNDFQADIVIHLAIHAMGIGYNKEHPGKLFYDNLNMGTNLMEIARQRGVKKFVAIGTAVAYPEKAKVPYVEEDIWQGYPEQTLASLGLANKMMLVQSQAYRKEYGFNSIYVIPANLYGPADHFDERAHFIPSIINRFNDAIKSGKETVEAWGTGKASREFLYVEDCARGIILALKNYDKADPLNLGSGEEITVKEITELIADKMGFKGEIFWNSTKPEGQLRRCLDNSRLKQELDFEPKVKFKEGIQRTIDWYKENNNE